MLGISIGFLGFIVVAWVLAKYLHKMPYLGSILLVPATAKSGKEFEANITTPPESKGQCLNIGDIGEVVSKLRPAGKAKFDASIVDVVAEGEFLDKGTKVEIIEVHGNRVVVKKVNS